MHIYLLHTIFYEDKCIMGHVGTYTVFLTHAVRQMRGSANTCVGEHMCSLFRSPSQMCWPFSSLEIAYVAQEKVKIMYNFFFLKALFTCHPNGINRRSVITLPRRVSNEACSLLAGVSSGLFKPYMIYYLLQLLFLSKLKYIFF